MGESKKETTSQKCEKASCQFKIDVYKRQIHTNFFISVLARTDDIVLTLDRCSNNIKDVYKRQVQST